jgi:hypothetical protein
MTKVFLFALQHPKQYMKIHKWSSQPESILFDDIVIDILKVNFCNHKSLPIITYGFILILSFEYEYKPSKVPISLYNLSFCFFDTYLQ